MDIIGAVLFMLLPYLAGYSCKCILRWKETNQIETYLIGFFFLFFLQGVILIPCVWLGKSLTSAGSIFLVAALVIAAISAVLGVWTFFAGRKKDKQESKLKPVWKKTDRSLLFIMIVVFLLILVRMFWGIGILREDITLETILASLQSDSLFKMHPLTGRPMEAGMIASKKIVTLPLFYACIARLTGLEADILIYLVVGGMVLLCSYYATALLFSKITVPARGKLYIFWIAYGLLLLAGDYHTDTLAYRMLYRGYDGPTICFGVILPYLLYLIVSWYKQESGEEVVAFSVRVKYVLKMLLGLAVCVVITGLGTGFVFLFMAMVIAGICCLLKSIKEVRACRE